MKNVVVNYLGRKGAGAVIAYEMAKGLAENGCAVYAIIPDTIENLDKWKQLKIKKLILIKTYHDSVSFVMGVPRFFLIERAKIRRALKGIKIDICYIPMLQPWSELVNKAVKAKKTIVTLHDPIPHSGSKSIMNYLYTRVTKQADEIVLLSEVFKKETAKRYNKDINHIHIIPHGVFDYYSEYHPEQIERTQDYNFLFFGRITKYKGLHVLSAAYEKLYQEFKNISLYVVGSGDFSEYTEEFDQNKNMTVVNRFVGDEELVAFFRGKRIITVLPYLDATQSGVIPIAMKEESQLIVSNKGGLAEQTCYGRYAVLAEPTSDEIYKSMKDVMLHYDEYSNMRRDAKAYIETLSWGNLSKRLIELM